MTTPKDIIAEVIQERGAADAERTAGEIIFSLAQAGFALTKRRAAMPVAQDADDDGPFFGPSKRQAADEAVRNVAAKTREQMLARRRKQSGG